MTTRNVVLVVLAILFINAVLVPWLKRGSKKVVEDLRARLIAAGDEVLRDPESAAYRGATTKFPKIAVDTLVALTDRRLVFRRPSGQLIEVPNTDIIRVREDKKFQGFAYRNKMQILLTVDGGVEMAFVPEEHHAEWIAALKKVARKPDPRLN